MRNFILAIFLFVMTAHNLQAQPRILELLPEHLVHPLAIEPAIPQDFVMAENPYESAFYWGRKKVLDQFIKDGCDIEKLEEAIIIGKISTSVGQHGESDFTDDFSNLDEEPGISNVCVRDKKWGKYPLRNLKCTVRFDHDHERDVNVLFVGLNAGSPVMEFLLLTPKNPTKDNLKLWNDFMNNTKQLSDPEYFKACGYDLQEGYTIVTKGKAQVKAIAEERISDGQIRGIIQPLNDSTEFKEESIFTAKLTSEWKFNSPLLVFGGRITYKEENRTDIIDGNISVLIKRVDQFSEPLKDAETLVN